MKKCITWVNVFLYVNLLLWISSKRNKPNKTSNKQNKPNKQKSPKKSITKIKERWFSLEKVNFTYDFCLFCNSFYGLRRSLKSDFGFLASGFIILWEKLSTKYPLRSYPYAPWVFCILSKRLSLVPFFIVWQCKEL